MSKLDELNNQGFTTFKKAFPIEMADEVIKDYYSNISIWAKISRGLGKLMVVI